MSEPIDLRAGEQKSSRAEDVVCGCGVISRRRANRLNAAKTAIFIDVRQQSGPSFFDYRQIGRAVEDSAVDSIGERIDIEGRAGVFRQGIGLRIEQPRTCLLYTSRCV